MPGQRASRASMPAPRSRPDLHLALGAGEQLDQGRGQADPDRAQASHHQGLDREDGRQVLRDAGPALALVGAGEQAAGVGAEIDPGRLQRVGRHRLAQHGEVGVPLRQAVAQVPPAPPGVPGAPDRGAGLGRVAAGRIAVERQEEQRVRVAGMGGGGKAEARGQALLDARPAAAAILASVHAAMVLLVEPVGHARRHGQVVHALAGLGVALLLGQEVAARAAVAGLPGPAAVRGVEHAAGRDRDPELLRVLGMGHQRVQDQPAAAGLPVRPRGMLAQAGDVAPGPAAVVAAEQARGLDPGIDGVAARRRCSRPSGSAFRRRRRPGPRWNGSSSHRGRSTSRPPGRTTRCRRRHRSCRWQGRP